jgi:hypothetical protein
MPKYTEKMFQKDLSELESLVNTYNAVGGSKNKRSFRVVEVDGKPIKVGTRMAGRYHIKQDQNPSDAAKKAYTALCNKKNKRNAGCKCTFTLRETTRGSKHKEYGPYLGTRKKLSKPIKVKFPKGTVTYEYDSNVKLVGQKGGLIYYS